jgi:hypothetical protein
MAKDVIAYDRKELSSIIRAFKAMDEEAVQQAKETGSKLAQYAANEIKKEAGTRRRAGAGSRRVAEGVKVSKSSKVGELSYGFASQKFSGGATTQMLWGGLEFGSNRKKQFPPRTRLGYFIYPALRRIQPNLVKEWEESFSKILKEYD